MLFNLVFANDTILLFLLCFILFFLITDLCFLIPAVIAQKFNPTAIPKEAKPENETHPVTAEAKVSKCSI